MIGNGQRVRFWRNIWCCEAPLAVYSMELFTIASNQDAWEDEVWNINNGHGEWNLNFTRHFNDREIPFISALLMMLEGYKVDQLGVDRPLWTSTKN